MGSGKVAVASPDIEEFDIVFSNSSRCSCELFALSG